MSHIERVDLDGAGSVQVAIGPDGVLLEDVAIAPGWTVVAQHPRPGLLRRKIKPAAGAVLVLGRTGPDGAEERELEVNQLADGGWEQAVRWQGACDPARPVTTPGGKVAFRMQGDSPVLVDTDPAPGWTVRGEEQSEDDVVVVFARAAEEWEVVLLVDLDGRAISDVDHRRQLGRLG